MNTLLYQQREDGAALVVGLIMLALMTIIGVTAVQSSIVENRIATNTYDKQFAFESAEASLRDAEAWLDDQSDHPPALYDETTIEHVWPKDVLTLRTDEEGNDYYISGKDINWDTKGLNYGALSGAEKLTGPGDDPTDPSQSTLTQPKFVIEEFTFVPDDSSTATITAGKGLFFYRITAQGYGVSMNNGKPVAVTTLQTMYRKRYR